MNCPGDTAALGDIAEFIRGITFKPDDVVSSGTSGSVRCMRTKNVQAEIDLSDVWSVDSKFVKRASQYLRTGDLLVSSANSWNLVGKCCWVPEEAIGSTFGGFISALRPNRERVDPRYLYHWFSSARIQTTVRSFGRQTTNISNLDFSRCLSLPVPLPSLDMQRWIAQLLDSVDVLRVKRRKAIALLDDLTQSIFLEMFGDPTTNPKRWEVESLGALARVIRGASPRPKGDPKYFGGPIPWLMISDVTKSPGDTVTKIREGVTAAGRDKSVYLKAGTLILTNSATVGFPKFLGLDACIHDGFLAILDISNKVDPMYLYQFFKQNREKISSLAPEGTQKNLNTGIAKALSIPVPPLAIQQVFCRSIEQINLLRSSHQAHLAELNALFASLQYRAFRGELWAGSPAA